MKNLRIVPWPLKLTAVVSLWVVGSILLFIVGQFGLSGIASGVITYVIRVGSVLLAARVFRGKDEPVEPARVWWRMTAWEPASRLLGVLFVFATVVSVLALLVVVYQVPQFNVQGDLPALITSVALYATIAFLYLNSAIRLKRAGIERPEPPEEEFQGAP